VHLEQCPYLVHLLEVECRSAEVEAHRLADRGGVDCGDAQPAARPYLDHALGDERTNGFSHDRPGDVELLAELAFRREPVPDLEPPRQDRLEHHLGDLVREARLSCDLLEQHLAARSRLPSGACVHPSIIRHTACRFSLDDWYTVV
jgi:hypothetical protein